MPPGAVGDRVFGKPVAAACDRPLAKPSAHCQHWLKRGRAGQAAPATWLATRAILSAYCGSAAQWRRKWPI